MARRWLSETDMVRSSRHGAQAGAAEHDGRGAEAAGSAGAGSGRWRRFAFAALASVAFAAGVPGGLVQHAEARSHRAPTAASTGTVALAQLPREAVDTLSRIAAGGPYPYEKDGVVFGNYERILPPQRRGYYHEYTVPTPSAHNRGARRIVCGGPLRRTDNCFYTDDHYNSFRQIVE